ncbi:MAG: hypothetical protein Q9225_000891 [Loekoesia sp. 1 TL-2023]
MAIQDTEHSAIVPDSAAVDQEAEKLQDQIESARSYERLLKANLAALRAGPSIEDVRANVTSLELKKEELMDRLDGLRSGKINLVPAIEKEAVDKAWIDWKRKADSRKRIFVDMWAIVCDGLPEGQTKEQLWVRSNPFIFHDLLKSTDY